MPWLEWLDRKQDVGKAATAPYRLLEPVHKLDHGDEDAPNMLIEGDNLDALKALLPYYGGQVKCIFIDPPYNTQSAFEHYDDNLEHAKWLSMMYPRLELLKRLLAEEGSIWITLDDNEVHYLKVVMDEIFGRRNFVATVVWEKADSPRNSARQLSEDHDHMLVYSKQPDWKPNRLPRTEEANAIYRNPDNDPRGLWLPGDPYANKPYSKGLYTITGPTGRTFQPPAGRFWRISEEKLRELDADGRVWWGPEGSARPSIKRYLSEVGDLVPRTLWRAEDVGSNRTSKNELRQLFPGDTAFGTPKPEALLQRVLQIATKEGDLVLDSFLGSGTTAAVAHKMKRRWIGVEMEEHITTYAQPRLEKVVNGEQGGISRNAGWTGGGGFRYYKLGPSVFDENNRIRDGIKFEWLAAHVWFSETGIARATKAKKSPLLGVHEGTAYYLLYNGVLGDKRPDGGNVLTLKVLSELPEHEGRKVIYGEATRLSPERLASMDIVFKQTPYDLKAR